MNLLKKYEIYIVLFVYCIVAALTIFFFDGTGDAGDSILHYQFAKSAPTHPELFFDHWAKPLFTLIASPFAQFGFVGMKVFNALVVFFTLLLTYKITKKLGLQNSILSSVILLFSPLYFVFTFSGLTEPLFALFICLGIYSVLLDRRILALIIISFLPFIRSEGLIIMGGFGLYFLLNKQWKLLPWLAFGHVAYSLVGFFASKDILWVFTEIPYANLGHTFGSGELSHFAVQLIYVVGIPIYALFWVGVIAIIYKSIKKKIQLEIQILILFTFLTFIIAHTIFWYLGIFNSMGLIRVVVGVAPLMAIIALIGFNFIFENILNEKKVLKQFVQGSIIAYILIFPFTANQAAIHWENDMKLTGDQKAAEEVATFITDSGLSNRRFVFTHPYLSEVLSLDHFDDDQRVHLSTDFLDFSRPGDIIIWENWFAKNNYSASKESLDSNRRCVKLYDLSSMDENREVQYFVYELID